MRNMPFAMAACLIGALVPIALVTAGDAPGGYGTDAEAGEYGAYGLLGAYGAGLGDTALPSACTCPAPPALEPTCGADGETYDSACHAECAGVTPIAAGRCSNGCICNVDSTRPFCGLDGVTYPNGCLLDCVIPRINSAYAGPCQPDCSCDADDYSPVCATNFNDYHNVCFATCAGLDIFADGPCDAECDPDDEDDDSYADYDAPGGLCGADGVTYTTGCAFHLAQVDLAYKGACDSASDCADAPGGPVCGADGATYRSACLARQAPVAVIYAGECMQGCPCSADVYAPVCATSTNTYVNECFRRCALDFLAHEGECPDLLSARRGELFGDYGADYGSDYGAADYAPDYGEPGQDYGPMSTADFVDP